MRKSLIVIGIFVVLAAVALVFGLEQFGVGNITGITHPTPGTGNPGTIDPNSVRVVFERTEGNSWSHHPVRINNPSVTAGL